MNTLYNIIGLPFGYLMRLIYMVVPNYAWAIIIFTLVTKLLFFPISYKTQKGAARMRLIQPKILKLQKSYSSNPTLLQQKTQELYAQEGYNPMGSCLPSIIQMLLLFGVIDVVYKPITHILHMGKDVIAAATEQAAGLVTTLGLNINGGKGFNTGNLRNELFTMEILESHKDEFSSIRSRNLPSISPFSAQIWVRLLLCTPMSGIKKQLFSALSLGLQVLRSSLFLSTQCITRKRRILHNSPAAAVWLL